MLWPQVCQGKARPDACHTMGNPTRPDLSLPLPRGVARAAGYSTRRARGTGQGQQLTGPPLQKQALRHTQVTARCAWVGGWVGRPTHCAHNQLPLLPPADALEQQSCWPHWPPADLLLLQLPLTPATTCAAHRSRRQPGQEGVEWELEGGQPQQQVVVPGAVGVQGVSGRLLEDHPLQGPAAGLACGLMSMLSMWGFKGAFC